MPQLVTAEYTTAFAEADQQLSQSGDDRIDAMAVQARVLVDCHRRARAGRGSPDGAVPRASSVVEPETAAWVMTALAAGEPIAVSASQVSARAVLQCGTISLTVFANLQAGVSCCLAIEDSWASTAASELRACGVPTGPSGAAGIAGLLAAFNSPLSHPLREHLGLLPDARLLVVATEAATALEYVQHAVLLPKSGTELTSD